MSHHSFLPTALAVLLWAGVAAGQEPAAAGQEPPSLRGLLDAAVAQVEVFASEESQQAAKPLVALRWANNARGSEDGMTILYVLEGRPLAAACLYPWAGNLVHDLESLSRGSIVARQAGKIVWQPRTSGIAFASVPDAPAPAATRVHRLRQMKSLAERFKSSMLGWKADSTDREELRLLPKPLYRYEIGEPADGMAVIDGAVFAFVMGTDPESLLLIEAVQEDGGPVWQYAFARRTSGELEGRLDDKAVWHAARYPETKVSSRPHFSLGTPIPPELLPAHGP